MAELGLFTPSCSGDKPCLGSPQETAVFNAGAALTYIQIQLIHSVRCKITPVSHILHLGFQWTLKPNPKANSIGLPRKVRSAARRGQLEQAESPGLRPWHGRRSGGADSTASHRMTQFREALSGRTHAQELPGQQFPHPVAPTLCTQRKGQ